MTELPRSRALVLMDGPGHIMPFEPVTPPDSAVWRVVHFPVTLGIVAAGLLLVAALAIRLLQLGVQFPGARYLVPMAAAAMIVAAYWVYVRVVERRPNIEELGARGWLRELGLGFCAGLGLSLAAFAVLNLVGGVRVYGFNPPQVMPPAFVLQLCTAIILEILLRGLLFALVERLLGSWLALLVTMLLFAAVPFLDSGVTTPAVAVYVVQAGLLFTALYMVTRRLWAAIGLHAAWLIGQIGFYGAPDSPSGPKGFVLSRLTGPDWLTGGPAGPDASAPALAFTALTVLVLLVVAVRRGRIVRPAWRRGRSA